MTPVPWSAFAAAEPGLARRVGARLAAHRHLVMATLGPDGSPRLCGTEARIVAGELELGAMAGTARLADLARDPRLAIHSGSDDPPGWTGDASIRGRALVVTDAAARAAHLVAAGQGAAPGDWVLLRVRLDEVVHVGLAGTGERLVVESWRPGRGLRRRER